MRDGGKGETLSRGTRSGERGAAAVGEGGRRQTDASVGAERRMELTLAALVLTPDRDSDREESEPRRNQYDYEYAERKGREFVVTTGHQTSSAKTADQE